MKKICIIFCIICITIPAIAQVTEEYSVHPDDTGKPNIEKRIIIDRTTIKEIIVPVYDLKQQHDKQKAAVLEIVALYNDLLEQLNDIIDDCGLPPAWKQQYMVISYSSTKP